MFLRNLRGNNFVIREDEALVRKIHLSVVSIVKKERNNFVISDSFMKNEMLRRQRLPFNWSH